MQKEKFERAIRIMETHLHINPQNELYLDVLDGAAIGLDEPTFDDLKARMEQTNARLRAGEFKLSEVHFGLAPQIPAENSAITTLTDAGWTGVAIYWWGFEFYFSESWTQVIVNMLWIGDGVAVICTAIAALFGSVPGAVICGLAAGIITIGAGTIGAVDALGDNQGIIIATDLVGNFQWIWYQ
ncbi:MAG: hypothetical protein PHQ40_21155 [Anaerolineaceae bacterium]|nr:hypothetical protein [Anaerolineaceae bacterium]